MKLKLLFLFILTLFMSMNSFSQNCGSGAVTLSSQADVDTFVSTYAGTCNNVFGNLTIETNDVVDISGLSFLTSVFGQVYIYQTSLTSLDGLQNIASVASQLIVDDNFYLDTFLLPNLAIVGNYIKVDDALNITTIDLSSLSSINSSISFEGTNGSVFSEKRIFLTNLSNLISADFSSLTNTDYISIFSCSSLSTLNFDSLITIDENFQFFHAESLISVNIPNLKSIEGNLFIQFIGSTSLDSFLALRKVSGEVNISNNANLNSIDALKKVQVLGSDLQIKFNPLLDECCAVTDFIHGPNYIAGAITITNNNTNCTSLSELILNCNISQVDTDEDSIIDTEDNCLSTSNPNQEDTDSDGIGDACDNCPDDANDLQEDANNNGIGDACEDSGAGADAGTNAGGLGVGTTSPNSQFEIAKGDVFIKNIHRGVIMKSPSGKCFRMQPNDEGILKGTEIACPDN